MSAEAQRQAFKDYVKARQEIEKRFGKDTKCNSHIRGCDMRCHKCPLLKVIK